MNLQKLRERNAANVKVIKLGDDEFPLRKLTAKDGAVVGNALMALGHTDPDGPAPTAGQQHEANVLLLSKSIVGQDEFGSWVLSLDSDEGRAELANLKFQDAHELGVAALEWSGFLDDTAKKN